MESCTTVQYSMYAFVTMHTQYTHTSLYNCTNNTCHLKFKITECFRHGQKRNVAILLTPSTFKICQQIPPEQFEEFQNSIYKLHTDSQQKLKCAPYRFLLSYNNNDNKTNLYSIQSISILDKSTSFINKLHCSLREQSDTKSVRESGHIRRFT